MNDKVIEIFNIISLLNSNTNIYAYTLVIKASIELKNAELTYSF